ncbi:MAG: hypothetical protein ACYC2H_07245 [Thermoplasmatota archaeon]
MQAIKADEDGVQFRYVQPTDEDREAQIRQETADGWTFVGLRRVVHYTPGPVPVVELEFARWKTQPV